MGDGEGGWKAREGTTAWVVEGVGLEIKRRGEGEVGGDDAAGVFDRFGGAVASVGVEGAVRSAGRSGGGGGGRAGGAVDGGGVLVACCLGAVRRAAVEAAPDALRLQRDTGEGAEWAVALLQVRL